MMDLSQYFEVVYGPEDVGKAKPDPAMLVEAIAKLGATRQNSLYVGDMVVDIETGKNAGVAVWVVPTGSNGEGTLLSAEPDALYPGMAELIADVLN
jgi:phosphoglycolate phosphatase-like HAD superfamily hydrolase